MYVVSTVVGGMMVLVASMVLGGRLLDWMRAHRTELWRLPWPREERAT